MFSLVIFLLLGDVVRGEWQEYGWVKEALNEHCRYNPAGPLNPTPHQTHCSAIVDDKTRDAPSRSPWSYTPICVDPVEDSEETSRLCTYTVTSLRGGPGLSVITRPDIAARMASTLQQPEIAWLELQRGIPFKQDPRVAYEVKDIPNKGYGVIATSFIPKDSVVMLELPYMLKISESSPWNHKGSLALMQQAAKRLSSRDQSRLLQMARQDKGFILDDIFRTNSFGVSVEGVRHAALYPDVARINHDCKPNTVIQHSTTTLALEIIAYRDIHPGEEITLSYLSLNLRYHQRLESLKNWGFTCTCSFCANESLREQSDLKRTNIESIMHAILRQENITRDIVSRAVGKLHEITEEEGLSAQMGDLLYMVANACKGAGDLKLAREIGEEALRVSRKYAGFDNDRTMEVVRLLEEVEEREKVGSATASVR